MIGWDLETFPIGPGAVAPKPVCGSFAIREGENVEVALVSNGDDEFSESLALLYVDGGQEQTGHNSPFDVSVVIAHRPDLRAAIFATLAGPPSERFVWARKGLGKVHDTLIREKLLNLASQGSLEFYRNADGSATRLEYSLVDLEKRRIGRDRSAEKGEDAWRNHYQQLDGVPSKNFPKEAAIYNQEDAEGALLCHESQEEDAEALRAQGIEPFSTEKFQVACAVALRLMTCTGWAIDETRKHEILKFLERELAPEKLPNLLRLGILRPAQPPRPHARGAKNADGTPKMTKGVPESRDMGKLQALVTEVCNANGVEIKETPSGGVCTDKEVLENIAHLHPALEEYQARQKLQKLVTTEIPRMGTLGMVWPNFNPLVETGRTSSYEDDYYPSCNIQNVDPRARGCYVPRCWTCNRAYSGKLECVCGGRFGIVASVDYNSLEFVSMAQTCYSLFGESKMRDLLIADIDPHAYLGAQLAYALDNEFNEFCDQVWSDLDASQRNDEQAHRFAIFEGFKDAEDESVRDFFKKYRKFAKPVGFGFPGGLGPDTFISFAKSSYQVTVTRELAAMLREVWFQTYPEMKEHYFPWIQGEGDPFNPGTLVYTTPLGMRRSGCSFCSAANGRLLQSPAAEGAKLATFEVVRACFDPTYENGEPSPIYGCKPLAFVHDEILIEIPDDEFAHERCEYVKGLMVGAMSEIMTDVPVKAKATLQRRWNKDAEPTYQDGRLVVTEEKAQ